MNAAMDDEVEPEIARFLRSTINHLIRIAEMCPEEQVKAEVRRLTCQVYLFVHEVFEVMCQTKTQAEKLTIWLEVFIFLIFFSQNVLSNLVFSNKKS